MNEQPTTKPYTGNETKLYRELHMGWRRCTVSCHDGRRFHSDGSPFYDIAIFKSRKAKDAYVRSLVKLGYREAR